MSRTKGPSEAELVAAAKERGELWCSVFRTDGVYDADVIQHELNQRTCDGKPVHAFVARGPREAMQIIREQLKKADPPVDIEHYASRARECLWDYHLLALHECAYWLLPDEAHEVMKDQPSLVRAFEHGMGYLVAMGELVVGIVLPRLERDENNNLHCETGPCQEWPDGTKEYRFRGIRVPEEWIENPNDVDLRKEFRDNANAELRRIMAELFGWDRLTKALGSREIQRDDYGALIECDVDGDGNLWRMVDVKCPSTDRRYVIPVPPNIETCRAGLAWSADMPEDQYELAIET